uniref:Uncharacterized protein n=1 Tax=Leersia perrieri TaxID=77586 RepID=A0A0D9WPI2_9ORYZ
MKAASVVAPRVSPSWFTTGGVEESEMLLPLLLLITPEDDDVDDQALRERVEEIEHLLADVRGTLSSLDTKGGRIQGQIAAASRGRRHRTAPAPAVAVPGGGRSEEAAAAAYTREGAGAVRKRLKVAAGDVKKARERLEAVVGELEAAVVDGNERLALRQMLATAAQ